jgi:uncharacterized protein
MSPYPLSQFVVKVTSRCDLACDHCYVFEHADQSWRDRPRVMSVETARSAAHRIAEHAGAHQLDTVRVVLHGGEPLLAGIGSMESILEELSVPISRVAHLDLRMQSNGVRLTEAMCDLLARYGVRVGISLDGDLAANDRHRRFPTGHSSHAAVRAALELLRRERYVHLYAGILCTVDIENDPIEVYEALLAERPPRIDFLLPHATWEAPPAGVGSYGPWLLRIYDRWRGDGRPVPIRLFDSLLSTANSGRSGTEAVGLDPADLVVIETDGAWEQADSLKTAYHGAPGTGLNVFSHSVDEVAAIPAVAQRQTGLAALSPTCRACEVVRQCGGGLYAHRYRRVNGFDNPSVYCTDLLKLVTGINAAPPVTLNSAPAVVDDGVPAEVLAQIGSGYGDAGSVAYLATVETAITRALLVGVAEGIAGGRDAESWALLSHIDRTAPHAMAAILAHPYVRPWAVGVLTGSPTRSWLGNLAAAAAVRGGLTVRVPVDVRSGRVCLPTVGTVVLPSAASGMGILDVAGDRLSAAFNDVSATVHGGVGEWLPALWVPGFDSPILVEDQDPYRSCHQWPADGRLPADAADAWRQRLTAAWEVIASDGPRYVPGLLSGLRAITPLGADPAGQLHASTSRHAFGAVATVASSAASLAVVVVHEFQHSKLGALLDLCDLVDPADTRRLRVGWRDDARPIEAVLQGTYAHLAVTDLWRSRAQRGSREAGEHYRRYRDWTSNGVDLLRDCGALTRSGAVVVDRLAHTLTGLTE